MYKLFLGTFDMLQRCELIYKGIALHMSYYYYSIVNLTKNITSQRFGLKHLLGVEKKKIVRTGQNPRKINLVKQLPDN